MSRARVHSVYLTDGPIELRLWSRNRSYGSVIGCKLSGGRPLFAARSGVDDLEDTELRADILAAYDTGEDGALWAVASTLAWLALADGSALMA